MPPSATRGLSGLFSTLKRPKKTEEVEKNPTQSPASAVNDQIDPRPANGTKSHELFQLGDFAIDEDRPMKIVVIGTGFSGIAAGIRFPQRIRNVDLTIYDKNAGVGGTWYTNRYPGLSCDIPSHCYQYTFEENTEWSSFYAPALEIRAYLERVVEKYKLMRYIRLQHEIIHARYNETDGKWHLRLRRPVASTPEGPAGTEPQFEEINDVADLVLCSAGNLSRWAWPEIEGLHDFKGKLLHSAGWDSDNWRDSVKDWGDKKVGVIGVGSSALQIVPALQPCVGKLYNFVRGQTWLATPFFSDKLAELMKRDPNAENYTFGEEDKKLFRDPKFYKAFRHELEAELNSVHGYTLLDNPRQAANREIFTENMTQRLEKKPWIVEHILPKFPVACRRLTPGPGYLEALCQDNVEYVPKDVQKVLQNGIETADGQSYDLDVLICATGYKSDLKLPFPVIGRGGKTLQERYDPHPVTYMSICTDGFPNWFTTLGPNSALGSGSLLVVLERQVEYVATVIQKLQRERLKSIEVKKKAVEDFDAYLESYFPRTVYSAKCRSWYKMGYEEGRVVGLWPGSCLHITRALERPRWEDYDYENLDDTPNRFHWLGDGWTYNEKYMVGDRAWYLDDKEVDIPPVPE